MFLLRFVLLYPLFLVSLFAENDNVLHDYYQSLLDIGSFYYELDVTTEEDYVKKILDDDFTLDNVIESDQLAGKGSLSSNNIKKPEGMKYFSDIPNGNLQRAKIVQYRELKEYSYISVVKLLKINAKSQENSQGKKISVSQEGLLSFYKSTKYNSIYTPLIINNFDINYLDYFMIYYDHYSFELIKVTTDNYFYKGTLKDNEEDLFEEVQIKFSKKYSIPTKIVLKDIKNKISVSIEVENVEKIGEVFVGSTFVIYDNGKKITLSAYNITLGIPIDIENSYKISFHEYIDLTSEAK